MLNYNVLLPKIIIFHSLTPSLMSSQYLALNALVFIVLSLAMPTQVFIIPNKFLFLIFHGLKILPSLLHRKFHNELSGGHRFGNLQLNFKINAFATKLVFSQTKNQLKTIFRKLTVFLFVILNMSDEKNKEFRLKFNIGLNIL